MRDRKTARLQSKGRGLLGLTQPLQYVYSEWLVWLTFALLLLLQFSVQLPSTLVVTAVVKKLAAVCSYHMKGEGRREEGGRREGEKRREGVRRRGKREKGEGRRKGKRKEEGGKRVKEGGRKSEGIWYS